MIDFSFPEIIVSKNVKTICPIYFDRRSEHAVALADFCSMSLWLSYKSSAGKSRWVCRSSQFSFFANAKFTFNSSTTTIRYVMYIGFMGALSATVGWTADKCALPPLVTLVTFSAISLVCGFIYSKLIVFRNAK